MGPAGEPSQPREHPPGGWHPPTSASLSGWVPPHQREALASLEAERDRICGPDMRVILHDLLELDAADALGGVAAVIAERARQVREGYEADERWTVVAVQHGLEHDSDPARLAAMLCAEIDRRAGR